MEIETINTFNNTSLDKAILPLEHATPFHTVGWAETLCRTYRYKPFYIAEKDGDKLLGLLPLIEIDSWLTGKRAVALPFTDCCTPLVDGKEKLNKYLEKAIGIGKKRNWKTIEFRASLDDGTNHKSVFKKYLNHQLHFNGREEAEVFKKFRSSTKRNIKKALKSGISVRVTRAYDDLCLFYHMNCVTRKDHSLPPQPFKFFKILYEQVITNNNGFVVLAEKEGVPIAGGLYLQFGKSGIYKYGASDKRYQSYRANNLVMWRAIQEFIKNDVHYLDFGRTDIGHDGLLQFKRGWGTDEKEIHYYKYDLRKESYQPGEDNEEHSYSVFSKMPLFMLKLIGRVLYRHVG